MIWRFEINKLYEIYDRDTGLGFSKFDNMKGWVPVWKDNAGPLGGTAKTLAKLVENGDLKIAIWYKKIEKEKEKTP